MSVYDFQSLPIRSKIHLIAWSSSKPLSTRWRIRSLYPRETCSDQVNHNRVAGCCRKQELLSLIGLLQHNCRTVCVVRTFLQRMIDLSSSVRELDHWVRLIIGFRSDLRWWELFLRNGTECSCAGVRSP